MLDESSQGEKCGSGKQSVALSCDLPLDELGRRLDVLWQGPDCPTGPWRRQGERLIGHVPLMFCAETLQAYCVRYGLETPEMQNWVAENGARRWIESALYPKDLEPAEVACPEQTDFILEVQKTWFDTRFAVVGLCAELQTNHVLSISRAILLDEP